MLCVSIYIVYNAQCTLHTHLAGLRSLSFVLSFWSRFVFVRPFVDLSSSSTSAFDMVLPVWFDNIRDENCIQQKRKAPDE